MKGKKQESISRRRKEMWRRYVSLLVAMVLVMGNVMPAISEGLDPICGKAEHTHGKECYTQVKEVICGSEETEGHVHSAECLGTKQNLICQTEASVGHQHDNTCYTPTPKLNCGLEDNAGHQHNENCPTITNSTLVCTLTENAGHVHEESCYEVTEQLICTSTEEGHEHAEECYAMVRTENLICGKEAGADAHSHDANACYITETVVNCEIPVGEGAHTHTDTCYINEDILTCTKAVSEGAHEHSEGCYETVNEYICGKAPNEGAHKHEDACYAVKEVLECTEEEHTHNGTCYPNEETEVQPANEVPEANEEAAETNKTEETEALRTGEAVYMGKYIENVTLESRQIGTDVWNLLADKVTEKAEGLSADETDELKITVEFKIPGGTLIGTTAVDYKLPLKSNEAVYQNKEEIVYALDKVTAIGKAVTATDGTVTITFDEEYLKANDNGTELNGTYAFVANAGELSYDEENKAEVRFLENEIVSQDESLNIVAVALNFEKEVPETDAPTSESDVEETDAEESESNVEETDAEESESDVDETDADETDAEVIENVVTFQSDEGANVLVDGVDVTNATAMAKNGTIYFEVQVAEGYELVSVIVDNNIDARFSDRKPGEYIIENIQTDATIVAVTTRIPESELQQPEEKPITNKVTFRISEGSKILVKDTDVAITENIAMAENGTICFAVEIEEGYELVQVLMDNEKELVPDETTGLYRIGNIKTDETVVDITTVPMLKTLSNIGEIAVTYAEGAVEKGAQLKVKDEIPNLENINQAINEKLAEKFEETAALRPFDINLTDNKGKAAEVTGEVTVNVTLAEPVSKEEAEEIGVEVYQVTDAGDAEEVTDITYNEEVNGSETTITGFSFTTEEPAPYVFVEKNTITTEYLTDEGETYEISVDIKGTTNIPASAKLTVRELTDAEYEEYVAKVTEALGEDAGEIVFTKLFDITIMDDETEIQPYGNVTVEIKLKDEEVSAVENTQVVHFGEITEVIEAKVEENKVKFEANGFSVYAIVGTETSDSNTRLTVNFYNGSELFETLYVKKSDLTVSEGDFSTIVYDPGVPDVGENELFKGWKIAGVNNTDGAYDVETAASTIDDIRNYIREQVTEIKTGDTLNIYAMIFRPFTVTYLDEKNVAMGTDQIIVTKDTTYIIYTINMAYTPSSSEQEFQGWEVLAGGENIEGYSNGTVYANESELKILGDVTFKADAPYGRWLIFDENGKGATYNAPQFVESGDVTVRPCLDDAMQRGGYIFGGWYTDVVCTAGNEFVFGGELSENTTIYAKWTAAQTANYSVIIWKENVAADGYDFERSITLNGTVGSTISSITQKGSGDNTYAQINGTNYQYTGFHLKEFDQGVTVVAEGTAVVNVYYDRTEYTLTFQKSSGYNRWTTIKTITAKYQQNISSNFPIVGTDGVTYNDGERWNPQNSDTYTEVLVYIDIMPAENVTFHLDEANRPLKTMNYYVEALPGTSGTVTAPSTIYGVDNKATSTNKEFILYKSISARYNFVTLEEDFINFVGFTRLGASDKRDDKDRYIYSETKDGSINFYYTRDSYVINYMDGVYVDGNGNPVTGETSRGNLGTSTSILYDANISSYNKGGADYFAPTYMGFVLEGWYLDDTCSQLCTFTTMPQGGITVYAKWRQIQYRVFLHPNAGTDASLDWGSESQSMNFRISYGDKVSTPTGIRDEYELIGWYMDPECTEVFNADAFVLNDTTVAADYYQDREMTDPMDKWGNIGSDAYNSDKENNRYWITKKLDLYAKWRAKLIGADGINVIYDVNGGTGNPSDSSLYLDMAQASAQEAPIAPTSTPPLAFRYWVVQRWNAETNQFEDTDVTVYPGDLFEVKKADARDVDNGDGTHTYTVQLRAEYGMWDSSTKTEIKWHSNTVDKDGMAIPGAPTDDIVRIDSEIKINTGVSIEEKPTNTAYNGYKFLGWARRPETSELWLEYQEDGTFKLAGTDTVVTEIAADNLGVLPNDIYALWQKENYKVTIRKVVSGLSDDSNKSYDFSYMLDNKQGDTFSISENGETVIEVPYNTVLMLKELNAYEYSMTAEGTVTEAGSTESKNLGISVDGYTATTTIRGNAEIIITNTRTQYAVDFIKINKAGTVLEGALFKLNRRPLGSDENTIYSAYDPDTLIIGNKTVKLISGEYELIEMSAPDGYLVLTERIYFSVDNNGDLTIKTATMSDGTVIATKGDGAAIYIRNKAGVALPNTGGTGTTTYTIGGLMTILVAGILLMYNNKKRRKEATISD